MKHVRRYMELAFAAFGIALAAQANAVPVDLELSLVIDVSPSIDATEFATQMSGYKAAFEDTDVQTAITGLPGGIAANVIFFSQNAVQKVGWTHIVNGSDADAFAAVIAGLSRVPPTNSGTDIAEGYNLAISSFNGNGFEGTRTIIDISGDGPQNLNGNCPAFGDGTHADCLLQTNAARAAAEAAGIVVNGLVVGPDDPLFLPGNTDGVNYFDTYIITSTGFAVGAESFDAYAPVIRDKIYREITGEEAPRPSVPEPSVVVLMGFGIVSLGMVRRLRRKDDISDTET